MDKTFDLSQFDEYREDNRREVKKADGGLPVSLWDTYSSFANCYGGVIILGVKENKDGSWRTTGLQNASKLRKELWDNMNNPKKVSINLLSEDDVQTYEVGDNKDVILSTGNTAKVDTFSLYSILEERRNFPDVIELKSMYDLATSIITYMRAKPEISWIICEGSDDKVYLEYILKDYKSISILPVGGCGNVVKLYQLL